MDEQVAGHRGDPRWWPGDMVRLTDDTVRLRHADGRWHPTGGVTSRFPAVMTDEQVNAALDHHYVSSPIDRWKTLANEGQAEAQQEAAEAAKLRARVNWLLDACDWADAHAPIVFGGDRMPGTIGTAEIRAALTGGHDPVTDPVTPTSTDDSVGSD